MNKNNPEKEAEAAREAIKQMAKEAEEKAKNSSSATNKTHLDHSGEVDKKVSPLWWIEG